MKQNRLVDNKATDDFVNSLELTKEKIKQDMEKTKTIEGFPKGDEEDILELSNPPYFTGYPNPYMSEFLCRFGRPYDAENDDYKREPFVGDVSEGKSDPLYMAHTYHTKVPYKAIMGYILHYSNKGDIIFDGFCGSGSTGIAAAMCERRAILADLSPAATFISSVFNSGNRFVSEFSNFVELVNKIESEYSWIYETNVNGKKAKISYVIWGDIFACPHCGEKFNYWGDTLESDIFQIKERCNCKNCNLELNRNILKRKFDSKGKYLQEPSLICYDLHGKHGYKKPDENDTNLIKKINDLIIPYWFPDNVLPDGDKLREPKNAGVKNTSDFFTKRNLLAISSMWDSIKDMDAAHRNFFRFIITSYLVKTGSKMHNIGLKEGKINLAGQLPNTLHIPSCNVERNIFSLTKSKMKDIFKAFSVSIPDYATVVSTQSATDLSQISANQIDYIFIDPPFGSNLMYSELSYLWESWLKVFTNNRSEAIINKSQHKEAEQYRDLIFYSFSEFFRILKPKRWMTVEFHNSQANIWKIIQSTITKAGFVIAQVAILNKGQGTYNQQTASGSVKNDLIINAYKPSENFRNNFLKKAGFNLEKEFLIMHLDELPVEPNVERSQQMLFSKLLAQYIQNSFEVRMDASEFYGLLRNNFVERDGFWFNKEQISEYEQRLKLSKNIGKFNLTQSLLGIDNEKTAIIWLAQFLRCPKTYSEISIAYNPKLMTSDDKIPELKLMLEENFVTENGKYRLPSMAEKKEKEDMRDKRLSREFQEILQEAKAGNKIVDVRKEALLHGLIQLYNKKDVDQIRAIGKKLDTKVLESDDEIYAIVDWALSKDD
jgi:DNA modification methylase